MINVPTTETIILILSALSFTACGIIIGFALVFEKNKKKKS